eukprot:TRINITY_DN3416_c0_g1_i1.p1 TRINITY_DN3416_c0_g1~~TRINITY_DN3416_c0_g1_i1.p1  ORF type:complete len:356 (+),score=66.29 TRINITY_DN3416_c0_g1_i1:33-1100(+)
MDSQTYKCYSCGVMFSELKEQQDHFKSLWHQENQRRRLTKELTLTLEEFEDFQAQLLENEKNILPTEYKCSLCHKTFKKEKSYNNHMQSKKHLKNARMAKAQEIFSSGVVSSVDEAIQKAIEEIPFDNFQEFELIDGQCFFCPETFDNFEDWMDHMYSAHGFTIPMLNYCTDLEGLIEWIAETICVHHRCVGCSYRNGRSLEALQSHMRDQRHCMLSFDTYPELSVYYEMPELNLPVGVTKDGQKLIFSDGSEIYHRGVRYEAEAAVNQAKLGKGLVKYQDPRLNHRYMNMSNTTNGKRSLLQYYNQKNVNFNDRSHEIHEASVFIYNQINKTYNSLKIGDINNNKAHFRMQNPI